MGLSCLSGLAVVVGLSCFSLCLAVMGGSGALLLPSLFCGWGWISLASLGPFRWGLLFLSVLRVGLGPSRFSVLRVVSH